MTKQLHSQNPTSSPYIKSQVFEFAVGIQLAKVFAYQPFSFRNAAELTYLFTQTGDLQSIQHILNWLSPKVESFIHVPINEQSNQSEKILAIATYLFAHQSLSIKVDIRTHNSLYQYVNYAADRGWFEEPFLAFFCAQLIKQSDWRESIQSFFDNNVNLWKRKRLVDNLAMYHILCGQGWDDLAIESSRQQLMSYVVDGISLSNLAWIMLSLTSYLTLKDTNEETHLLSDLIYHRLNEVLPQLNRLHFFIEALCLSHANGLELSNKEIHDWQKSISELASIKEIQFGETLQLSLAQARQSNIDYKHLPEIFWPLAALAKHNRDQVWGVRGLQSSKHLALLFDYDLGKTYPMKKWEMQLANLFLMIFTLITGLVVLGVLLKAKFIDVSIDLFAADIRDNLDVIGLWIVPLSILILLQGIAAFHGMSAYSQWLKTPIVLQFIEIIRPYWPKRTRDDEHE